MMTEPAFGIPKILDVETDKIRRYSTGEIMMPNVELNVVPRYLRNPLGSCHDICKYGATVNPETESMSPRSSIPKAAKPKQFERQRLTEKVSNFGEGRKKWVVISSAISRDSKIRKPDDVVFAKIAPTKFGIREGNVMTNLSDENSGSQKLVASECIRRKVCSWTDEENVTPKRVSFSFKETDVAVDYASFSKVKPQSKPPSILKPASSSGKRNTGGSKSKDTTDVMLMNSLKVSNGRNKGKLRVSKRRIDMMGEKKHLVTSSFSLSSKQSGISSSGMNKAKTKNLRGVSYSKTKHNSKKIKAEKSCGKNAKGKGSRNLKGVSHLTDKKNITKPNSAQGGAADIPEKTLFMIESNPENKTAESNQTSASGDQTNMPSPSSKVKIMTHTQKKTPIGKLLDSFKHKKMINRPKGIHARRLPPSSFPFPGKKVPGLNASSKSTHDNASSEHDEPPKENQKNSFKMMKKTSKDVLLQGEKANFLRSKVIEVSLEDCTPRRLEFKQRVLIDSMNDDNQNDRNDMITPTRLKFRQNGGCEDHPPNKLRFKHRKQEVDSGQNYAIEVQSNQISLRQNIAIEKKDQASLQNDMIEETAIRLAGTKKSKVKALVSAFESVISRLGTASFSETNDVH